MKESIAQIDENQTSMDKHVLERITKIEEHQASMAKKMDQIIHHLLSAEKRGPSQAELPDGWQRFSSGSRPGEFAYRNMITGERVRQRPTQPAAYASETATVAEMREPRSEAGSGAEAAGS